jgi:hypothetical protein
MTSREIVGTAKKRQMRVVGLRDRRWGPLSGAIDVRTPATWSLTVGGRCGRWPETTFELGPLSLGRFVRWRDLRGHLWWWSQGAGDLCSGCSQVDAETKKHLCGDALTLAENAKEQMLWRDVRLAVHFGLTDGEMQHLRGTLGEWQVAGRGT